MMKSTQQWANTIECDYFEGYFNQRACFSYLAEKIRCAGKTVFVRLTARSSRYYCSISCQPRNKVIKHCFTRHKDALFFINSRQCGKHLKNYIQGLTTNSCSLFSHYKEDRVSLHFVYLIMCSPSDFQCNFYPLRQDHFESWSYSNTWLLSFEIVF